MNLREHRATLQRLTKEALEQQHNADRRGDLVAGEALGEYAETLSQASIKLAVAESEIA